MATLTILGSGTGIPSAERGSPGHLVDGDGTLILMDSGPGVLRALCRAGRAIHELDFILYTHFHPDHTLDFLALCFALRNPDLKQPERPIRVYAPRGFLRLQQQLRTGYGHWIEPPETALEIRELPVERSEMELTPSLHLRFLPMNHTPTSLGYRIESASGWSVAYTGDTDDCGELEELAHNADVFLTECSFPDELKKEGHLTPSLAGAAARRGGARRLVLTHFYPPCEGQDLAGQCGKEYIGPVTQAVDFTAVELGRGKRGAVGK